MNKYVIMIVMIVTVYMLYIYKRNEAREKIQKRKKLIKKEIIPAVKPALDKSANILLHNLNDINNVSEKVTLKNIKIRWSLRRDLIDYDLNQKLLSMIQQILQRIQIQQHNYFIKTIENVYVMKDTDNNFRCITNFFIYDITHHYQFKVAIDFVSLNKEIFINYVDIDESAFLNITDKYDIKYNSQGILLNHNTFDETVEKLFNRHYGNESMLHYVNSNTSHEIKNKLYSIDKLTLNYLPTGTPILQGSPMFCNKYGPGWNKASILTDNEKDCVMQNPSTVPYPNEPYDAPGVVTSRVDQNAFDWLFDPDSNGTI
jgi:hypothetical protein